MNSCFSTGYVRKNLCNLLNSSSCYTVLPKKLDMSYSDCNSNGNSTAASICDNSDDEHISMTKLLQDNRELRSKLSLMKSLEQENQILRQELNLLRNSVEDDKLKQLLESRNEIQRLEHEKSALQDTLRFLQNEASKL